MHEELFWAQITAGSSGLELADRSAVQFWRTEAERFWWQKQAELKVNFLHSVAVMTRAALQWSAPKKWFTFQTYCTSTAMDEWQLTPGFLLQSIHHWPFGSVCYKRSWPSFTYTSVGVFWGAAFGRDKKSSLIFCLRAFKICCKETLSSSLGRDGRGARCTICLSQQKKGTKC